jgi:tetratricopeptide (TPR) repeat protein
LYTDDYFAYKRLKEPEQAEQLSEKAAAEMKSFTSWLKEMKHTFAEKASKQWYHQQMHRSYEDVDPEVSEAVEKMAMESITLNDDIVSETLAEIWARQHQYQTAIHIYQKLSLLNPNKSAYFAQKIKELQLLTEKS